MKCKKSIMGLAALLIVIFHFYLPVSKSPYEMAFYKAAYIGVDLFFFVSAYSLGQKDRIKYGSFILNRFCSLYIPFMVMAGICAIYKKWTLQRFFLVISGVEFFQKSGGAFLWFATGIMILYLLVPFFVRLKTRFGWKAFAGLMLAWLILAVTLQYGVKYTKIFILLNRIPIFLIGFYYSDIRKWKINDILRLLINLVVFAVGLWMVYKWGAVTRLNKPLSEIYYLIAIPLVVSTVGLFDFVSGKVKFKNWPLTFIGTFTFELYGLQMIFGYEIEKYLLKMTNKNKMLTFLLTTLALVALAFAFSLCRKGVTKLITIIIRKIKEKKHYEKENC